MTAHTAPGHACDLCAGPGPAELARAVDAARARYLTADPDAPAIIARTEPDRCPYRVGPRACIAGPRGHAGPHDWPKVAR